MVLLGYPSVHLPIKVEGHSKRLRKRRSRKMQSGDADSLATYKIIKNMG